MRWARALKKDVALASALAVAWVLLSGHYTPLLLGLGVASAAFVAWLARRMGLTIGTDLLGPAPRAMTYAPYLLAQIGRSSTDVIRRVLDPRLPISPTIVDVRARQRTDAWRVVYANSITLTPGTITVQLSGDRLRVHALTRAGAETLAAGEMDRRVAAIAGE